MSSGEDGRLIKMQLEELTEEFEEEELLIIKDYMLANKKKNETDLLKKIRNKAVDGLIEEDEIANILGYKNFENYEEVAVYTKGYRILSKIPRMPNNIVVNLVKSFKSFQHILLADTKRLDEVEGIGEIRARAIKQSLKRMQEQFVFDNVMV